ncbi:MAG: hypothetical protein JO227_24530 [Acetobacteraceae bacterium]|nr:hypothetical protein [Acetobacteraceae bacterium]
MAIGTERRLSSLLLVSPVVVATIVVALFSRLEEPKRRTLSAILAAGASGVYFNGGFGVFEFLFSGLVLRLAYLGLRDYRYVSGAWFLHTVWDVLHYFYGSPIIPMVPTSSAACAICDLVLAGWYWSIGGHRGGSRGTSGAPTRSSADPA